MTVWSPAATWSLLGLILSFHVGMLWGAYRWERRTRDRDVLAPDVRPGRWVRRATRTLLSLDAALGAVSDVLDRYPRLSRVTLAVGYSTLAAVVVAVSLRSERVPGAALVVLAVLGVEWIGVWLRDGRDLDADARRAVEAVTDGGTREEPDPERSEGVSERVDGRHYGDPEGYRPPHVAPPDVEDAEDVDS